MRLLPVAFSLSALALTGCNASAPTCDNEEVISRLKSKLTIQLQRDEELVPASAAVGKQQAPKRIAGLTKCISAAEKRLKAALKTELGVDSDEVPDFRSLKYVHEKESNFCSLRYENSSSTDFSGMPLPKRAHTPTDKEARCYSLFDEANKSYQQCSTAMWEEFDRQRYNTIAKIQFSIDEIRYKGSESQGLVLMCVATIQTADPNSGETTGEAAYTVEQTTDGKPFVTLTKAWGKDVPKP